MKESNAIAQPKERPWPSVFGTYLDSYRPSCVVCRDPKREPRHTPVGQMCNTHREIAAVTARG